jgi:uncharacterized membrane protein HdeD (DUF308 family)
MPAPSEFERVTSEERPPSLASDLWMFLRENKKWWLVPMLAVLLLLGGLVALSGTAAAPFIYTLF